MRMRRRTGPAKRDVGGHNPSAKPKFAPPPPPEAFKSSAPEAGDEFRSTVRSLHELFAQQARTMLDRTDLSEEQKQSLLVAMSCPCCGAGGLSFTAKMKIKRR
jgi:hypothetical protein